MSSLLWDPSIIICQPQGCHHKVKNLNSDVCGGVFAGSIAVGDSLAGRWVITNVVLY